MAGWCRTISYGFRKTQRTSASRKRKVPKDFPILEREVSSGKHLVYLDSTATAQKPLSVIHAMDDYYRRHNANIHRGVHTLAEEATASYEGARDRIAHFI